MRHQKSGYHLSRTRAHRKALLSNLSAALFERKRIRTTLTKAKAVRGDVEKYITFAKKGDLASRRHVLRYIPRPEIIKILFEEIAPRYEERAGGYSRIVKLGQRQGDGAPMAILELVGYEDVVAAKKAEASKKKAEKKAAKESKGEKAEEVSEETKPRRKAKAKVKAEKPADDVIEEAATEAAPEVPETEETVETVPAGKIPKKTKEKKPKKKK